MKLYEAFGESAPQAALQISIIIQTGTLGVSTMEKVFTSIGILISFFSLTLGASDLLLKMATKDNKVTFMCLSADWIQFVRQRSVLPLKQTKESQGLPLS